MRPRIDVTRAETELSQAKLSLVTSQFGGQEATLAFERLLGGPPSSGAYTLAEVAPAPSPTTALSPLIQKGLAARSEIAALQAQLDAAEAVVLAARRSAYPSLNAKGYSEE
jgi:outer membrane protein